MGCVRCQPGRSPVAGVVLTLVFFLLMFGSEPALKKNKVRSSGESLVAFSNALSQLLVGRRWLRLLSAREAGVTRNKRQDRERDKSTNGWFL